MSSGLHGYRKRGCIYVERTPRRGAGAGERKPQRAGLLHLPSLCCSRPAQKGPIKAPHFAHLITTGCEYERGEGQLHHRIKAEICAALAEHPQVSKLQPERRELREVSPDMSFCLKERWRVAVELQVSDIAISTIQRRVEAYTTRGIALLWVLPYHDNLIQNALYQSSQWERYLHALYRKKLYYWRYDETLQPVTYHDVTTTGKDY